mmetsp:Transcript_11911/g.26062  ORF Transcript_11911/g.26062 Transcript_11911/m.26062 type:complete len:224 (+) Transcript_11911:251-922(+)
MGHARVYVLDGEGTASSWKQLGGDIDGEASGDYSGYSVSLSANGKIIAIGAPGNVGNFDSSGHVRVYHMEEDEKGASWNQLGEDIDGEAAGDDSEWSVSLSADGKILAIGARLNDGNGVDSGHVRVYHMAGDGSSSCWQQLGQDLMVKKLMISQDCPCLFHGEGTASSWKQLGQDINGEAAYDTSGWSVSLSADGKTVAIGSPSGNGDNGYRSGRARVFNIDY